MKMQRSLLIAVLTVMFLLLSLSTVLHARSPEDLVLNSHAMAGTVMLTAQNKKVKLTIIVVDQEQKPVAGAQVEITHDAYGPEFRDYDYRLVTDANGVASTDIVIGTKWGEGSMYWPTVD